MLVHKLQLKGTHVYLVSGGMRIMINPIATMLNIPLNNVRAQTLYFNERGNYTGFDTSEPTCRAMGKKMALSEIRALGNYKTIVMIGDGATDMEAKSPGDGADLTVGFGANVVRDTVFKEADWFVHSFGELISEI